MGPATGAPGFVVAFVVARLMRVSAVKGLMPPVRGDLLAGEAAPGKRGDLAFVTNIAYALETDHGVRLRAAVRPVTAGQPTARQQGATVTAQVRSELALPPHRYSCDTGVPSAVRTLSAPSPTRSAPCLRCLCRSPSPHVCCRSPYSPRPAGP
ncbi:hypothetical protein SAV31267_076720 [Streptomyces avermitilis]|uniref:Uncharacterized protein n=1 Tax=Streptomyces avermitilis TaxID=33903 RepID=A0A4D4N4P0_STRAX|nr:hypothetical protein SAVMC3_23160 [Streptomyces avermitilis]GDY78187.1 hypothetical protein SAV31267_076720 [Streptomyces avermitilis]